MIRKHTEQRKKEDEAAAMAQKSGAAVPLDDDLVSAEAPAKASPATPRIRATAPPSVTTSPASCARPRPKPDMDFDAGEGDDARRTVSVVAGSPARATT